MALRNVNSNDFDLSLTGSQVSVSTSRTAYSSRPGSARNTGRQSLSTKNAPRAMNYADQPMSSRSNRPNSSRMKQRKGSSGSIKHENIETSNQARVNQGSSDRELYGKSVQPKILKPNGLVKNSQVHKKNSMSKLKHEGPSNLEYDTPNPTPVHSSHSIFLPASARSTSTIDDEFGVLSASLRQAQGDFAEMFLEDISPMSSRSQNQHDDPTANSLRGSMNLKSPKDEMMLYNNSLHSDKQNSPRGKKLNGLANNMTSNAQASSMKTPVMGLENAYQNIKPKTPVNQVRTAENRLSSSSYSLPTNGSSGDYNHSLQKDNERKKRNMAATKIQRWYKRHGTRRKADEEGEAAMKRLFISKKQQMEMSMSQDFTSSPDTEQRKRAREAKARHARQQAIQELQKKREEKRKQETPGSEVKFLQSSGKISKAPAHHKTSNVNRKKTSGPPQKHNAHRKSTNNYDDSDDESRPRTQRSEARSKPASTARSSSHKLEEFFQDDDGSTTPRAEDNAIDVAQSDEDKGPPPSSHAATKTTLEDLMDTLKKLEADEKLPDNSKENKNETPKQWLDDLDHASDEGDPDLLTVEKLMQINQQPKDNIKKSGFLTDEKLKSIMNFLDEVETADKLSEIDSAQQVEAIRANELLTVPAPLVPSGEEIAQLEQASAQAAEVTNKVLAQRLELDDTKRTVSMLQKALNQQRELTVRHAKETDKEMNKRLSVQKNEYEEAIKRHLSFIDQLIDDKKDLSEKCETLVKELKNIDKKYSSKIQSLTEKHDIEMRKMKEMHSASEKVRREKWIDEKTKKIKEMTVKGLEPEIQRLIAKHKEELRKLKSIHEAELLASDERAGQRYIQMTEELRDQLSKEKEAACARERELARQTYEKQLQQEEEAYQQQRRRLYAEVAEEKERISSAASRQRMELDKIQRQVEDNQRTAVDTMRTEFEKSRDEQERRHATELRQLREQLNAEKAAWEENYKKKQETYLLTRERELKQEVRKERDREINMAIEELERDNQQSRDEIERLADNRIKRIRDKYEAEMGELEKNERTTVEKYNHAKAQLAEFEGENERMKVSIKQKDREIEELKLMLEKLNQERDRVADVIRQEFADRIVATDEENKRVKNEMSEQKARHRIEIERMKTEVQVVQKAKEEEMVEVHKRVKQAIVKKEEVVTQLKEQYKSALKRADHLEGLLEQQRKQLLGKKGS